MSRILVAGLALALALASACGKVGPPVRRSQAPHAAAAAAAGDPAACQEEEERKP